MENETPWIVENYIHPRFTDPEENKNFWTNEAQLYYHLYRYYLHRRDFDLVHKYLSEDAKKNFLDSMRGRREKRYLMDADEIIEQKIKLGIGQ